MQRRLTKRMLDALRPPADRQYIFDSELAGFGVSVHPSGVKTFFVQYRTAGGRRGIARRVALGRYGALTVDQARGLARRHLGDVAHGGDPAEVRRSRRDAPAVRELGTEYFAEVTTRRKPRTVSMYKWLWNRHVLPTLGRLRVEDVRPARIAQLHTRLHGTPYAANRVLALLGAFFSFAERQGVRPPHSNPAHQISPYDEHPRERFLTPAEVAKLGEALERALTVGLPAAPNRRRKPGHPSKRKHVPKSLKPIPANVFAVAAVRFLLLSGWREREALTLCWADVDLENARATLPDTKTGRSVRQLGAPAVALLNSLPRVKKSPYVFPGRDPKKPLIEINRLWYAARHAAGLDDVRLHDLRHSFASTVASAGGSLLMIRALLGHKDTQTSARYAHLFDNPVKATADATAGQLAAWLDRGTDAGQMMTGSDVIPIDSAAKSRRTARVREAHRTSRHLRH